ncbi:MAG: Cell wall assembly/cell proliferation coordinating protein [Phycisphaerales bacterium]|nr:Cell wall assembly/cell proliferation coordinating protein [Phycisphaerales bacterium]
MVKTMHYIPGSMQPPPSDEEIAQFEETFRVKLPPEYIAELKSGNCGVPVENVFYQGRRGRLIERMLCIHQKPADDRIYGWYDIAVVLTSVESRLLDDGDLVVPNIIPIAALFAGDLVCLDYRKGPESPEGPEKVSGT